MRFAIVFGLASILASGANAAEGFQAIYKLSKGNVPAGFLIGKKETLPNKNMRWTAYVAIKDAGANEVYVMDVDPSLRPVSMTVTRKDGKVTSVFSGTVKGETFTTTKTSEAASNPGVKAATNLVVKVPTPSQWLLFVPDMLKSKGMFKPGAKTTVVTLVEDPGVSVVDATVGNDETVNGIKVRAVNVVSKDLIQATKFWMTDALEPVRVNIGGLNGDLVTTLADAAQGMKYDEAEIAKLMGGPVKSEHSMKAPAAPAAPAKK